MLAVVVSDSAEALSTEDVVVADVDAVVDDDDDDDNDDDDAEEDVDDVVDMDALREVPALAFEETDSVLACFRLLVVGSGLDRFLVPAVGSGLPLLDGVVDTSTVTASANERKILVRNGCFGMFGKSKSCQASKQHGTSHKEKTERRVSEKRMTLRRQQIKMQNATYFCSKTWLPLQMWIW